VKWILRYLKGTSRVCLCFESGKPVLNGYTDAYMAGDVDSRKSTSGYMMTFARGVMSWQSRLQKCVALSSSEAEYLLLHKLLRSSCGCINSYKSWDYHKKNIFYIVIVKVQSISTRTQLFIQGQSILKSDIIGYGMH